MRAVYDTMIVSPPLVISRGEIDELIDKARASLDRTARLIEGGDPAFDAEPSPR